MYFSRHHSHGCFKRLFCLYWWFQFTSFNQHCSQQLFICRSCNCRWWAVGRDSASKDSAAAVYSSWASLCNRKSTYTSQEAAQLYQWQGKHLHISLMFNCCNCPLHGSDLCQPKQCFKETWRAPGLGSISITQSASGHAVLEVRTALDSNAPHGWKWCQLACETLISYLLHRPAQAQSQIW